MEFTKPYSSRVAEANGRLGLLINNQPVPPIIYALTEGGRFTWEETPRHNLELFAKLGYKLYQIDIWFRDVWLEANQLDWPTIRKQLQGVYSVCADAAVFIRIHVDPPAWWMLKHPTECVGYNIRDEEGDKYAPYEPCLASEQWRSEADDMLRHFCTELARLPEGQQVIGMHLAGALYGEWHYWKFWLEPDSGACMTKYWRKWLTKTYRTDSALRKAWNNPTVSLKTAVLPTSAERQHTSRGVFRDPVQERRVMDYYKYQQLCTLEAILMFCHTIKTAWPRPCVVGLFYGYFHCMVEMGMVDGGHMELPALLKSPDVDYLSGPLSYEDSARAVGGTGQLRGLEDSLRLHGKLWLSETDHASHLGDAFKREPPKIPANMQQTIALHRRNFGYVLTHGTGLWWYDFGPDGGGGWWDHPEIQADQGKMKRIFDRVAKGPFKSVADVLFVYDLECFYGLATSHSPNDPISYPAVDLSSADAYHTGAAIDKLFLHDLEKADLNQYRVVIFANCFQMNQRQRRYIKKEVCQAQRTVIWFYAPGYSDGQRLHDAGMVSEITGMTLSEHSCSVAPEIIPVGGHKPFGVAKRAEPLFRLNDPAAEPLGHYAVGGAVGLARRVFPGYTSIYSALPLRGAGLMRGLFKQAGAHIYDESGDVLLVDNQSLYLHSADGGQRKLKLRDGRELHITMAPCSTVIYNITTGKCLLS